MYESFMFISNFVLNTRTTTQVKSTGSTILFWNSYFVLYFFPQSSNDFLNDN